MGQAAVTAGDRMWQGSTAQLHIPVLQQELCPSLIVLLHLVPIRISAGTLGPVISSSPQGWGPDGENTEEGMEQDHSSLSSVFSQLVYSVYKRQRMRAEITAIFA